MNFSMKILGEEVKGYNKKNVPSEDETIADEWEIEKMVPLIIDCRIYLRKKEDCPFNRGNWLIDIRFNNGQLFCIKLPKEMEKEHVQRFIQPLVDLLEKYKKSQLN